MDSELKLSNCNYHTINDQEIRIIPYDMFCVVFVDIKYIIKDFISFGTKSYNH